jgi:hypothetical protein
MLMSLGKFGACGPQGNCGPTADTWRCDPCERESELEGFSDLRYLDVFSQGPEAAAVTSSEYYAGPGHSAVKSIGLGVATGLVVWMVTRGFDAWVGSHRAGKRR